MTKQTNRGKEAKDDLFFNQEAKSIFKEALQDLNYLLTRAYSPKNALHTVGTRYRLSQRQIKALQGMGASEQYLDKVKITQCDIDQLQANTIVIDGFNVLILLESLFSGAYLFQGADGCYRDLSSVHGTYKKVSQTPIAIQTIVDFHKVVGIKEIIWIFDKPVSNSGRIKKMLEETASQENLTWTIRLEDKADDTIIKQTGIIISSDAYILENAAKWFNLIAFLIESKGFKANVF
ncbi:DUF434 domain-containing protein [Flavobacterium oreochromis]|uniref:DUF434 domain-containing protein n=1 Tax=Flavobacterium oreochromis TaxID=2906078 RepID=A0ABW8PC66_9FLAO|nr:DUF434 domain-containing protein [Flavobacterium oreochromis]OWP75391.1 hypothetical protein BWG23_11135 [Flavobacterium oreochromis]POR24860.1 hypothetical protein BWK58_07460 [Flavobacterium columnare]QYS87616.1 DUF434 domain-containing protein [Flavobacterium oreochromis]